MKMMPTAAMLGVLAMVLGPVPAALFPMAGLDSAHAENSKSNGNDSGGGNGKSSASHGNSAATHSASGNSATKVAGATTANTKGALASELKGLNAVMANPNALEHAAPNSQVGRIAAYRDAAEITIEAQAALDEAEAALEGMDAPTRSVDEIEAEIAALDPAADGYAEALEVLEAERDNAEAYADAVIAVDLATAQLLAADEDEKAALLVASGGRELSDEAIAYIRSVLNL
jgi:hypothetical protein